MHVDVCVCVCVSVSVCDGVSTEEARRDEWIKYLNPRYDWKLPNWVIGRLSSMSPHLPSVCLCACVSSCVLLMCAPLSQRIALGCHCLRDDGGGGEERKGPQLNALWRRAKLLLYKRMLKVRRMSSQPVQPPPPSVSLLLLWKCVG